METAEDWLEFQRYRGRTGWLYALIAKALGCMVRIYEALA